MSQLSLVGNPKLTRTDLIPRITGERKFSSDIMPADIGLVNGKFVYMGLITCPYPSAKVTKLDMSKAEAAGYVTLTGADLPTYDYYSNTGRTFLPLSSERVNFAGQPVAAVGSIDPDGVTDAIQLVTAEYEPLPYVFDAEAALQPGAPQLFEGGNSIIGPTPITVQFGDVETALSQADEVVSQRFDTSIQTHFELEPTALVAWWNNGTLNTYEKTNYAFGDRAALAAYFGLPLGDVICRNALGAHAYGAAGGIFGNSTVGDDLIIASAMSRKSGAPVKWVPTRLENSRVTTNRFPIRASFTFGGTRAGALTAMKIDLYFNFGARGGAVLDGPDDFYNTYNFPNLLMHEYAVNTNAYGLAAYMRDVGESQCHFMMESTIDMLAEKLDIDPITFRLNNMRTSAEAVDPVTKLPYSELGEPQTFNTGVSTFNWNSLWKGWGVPVSVNGTKRIGVGVGLMNGNKGTAFPPSSGQIQVNPNGSVVVYSGQCDQGAGTHTTIPIEAAQAIGLSSLDNVTYISADTSVNTDSSVTAGSEGTQNGGFAMIAAAIDLAKQWFPIVAAKLAAGTQASNLAFGGGLGAGFNGLGGNVSAQPPDIIYVTTNPSNQMSFNDAAALLTQSLTGYGIGTPLINFGMTHRVQGVKLVQLQVDTETAEVDILTYTNALDLGRIIFPKGAYSQSDGGFVGLGIGQAVFEETINAPSTGLNLSGSYLNARFLDMKVPTIAQTPTTINTQWIEGVDPTSAYGAKGIGELCLITVSAAITNALSNALGGYRFTKIPIRKEDIVAALQWMQENNIA